MVTIKCSVGELIDKLSILAVKSTEVKDENKLIHINHELEILLSLSEEFLKEEQISNLYNELVDTNRKLWRIEDDIRDCERNEDFGETFIKLARSVYFTNDYRFKLKNEINDLTNSEIKEQKDYKKY
jgi:hypothetical protein